MAIVSFTGQDFIRAVQQLLPTGDYWSGNSDELSGVVESIGTELHKTYLDISKSVLYQQDNSIENWRIDDYKALLSSLGSNAHVYDDPSKQNIIMIEIDMNDFSSMIDALYRKKLPHTDFEFIIPSSVGIVCAAHFTNEFYFEFSE